jgi:hypothetical protein
MNQEAALLRTEVLKQWVDKNKEFLALALLTEKVEITISMKGPSIKAKVTQYPDEF